MVAPGYTGPWAAPGMPLKVARHLFAAHAPVRIVGTGLNAATLAWLWRWWRACRAPVYRANRARMHRLAHFSRERLQQLTQRLHLDFERGQGLLVLLRSERELALAEAGHSRADGARRCAGAARCRRLSRDRAGAQSADAAARRPLLEDDEVGNCREFTHLLRKEAERAGARFRFHAARRGDRRAGASRRLRVLQTPHDARDERPARARRRRAMRPSPNPSRARRASRASMPIVVCAAVESRRAAAPARHRACRCSPSTATR